MNQATLSEIARLERLTEAGCTSTPRLLDYQRINQTNKMWLPGGYMVCILMELLPGISLENFWVLPREERDQIRNAFRVALEYVEAFANASLTSTREVRRLSRLDPADMLPQNLLWDKQKQKW